MRFKKKRVFMLLTKTSRIPIVGKLIRHRFVKFSIVGFSGMIINLGSLYVSQEFLFRDIRPEGMRLNLSLGVAIFLATINNYLWNRAWTWIDRKGKTRYGFFPQMGQYFIACGLAIGFQFGFTILFSQFIHYMIANIIAIIIAAVLNYLLNNTWTFSIKKPTS